MTIIIYHYLILRAFEDRSQPRLTWIQTHELDIRRPTGGASKDDRGQKAGRVSRWMRRSVSL